MRTIHHRHPSASVLRDSEGKKQLNITDSDQRIPCSRLLFINGMLPERRGGLGTMILDTVTWMLNDRKNHL